MSTRSLTRVVVRAVIIILAVLAVYGSSLDNEAITALDDSLYVTNNPLIQEITWKNISRLFSEFYYSDYLPLTFLSLAVDYHFWNWTFGGII